MLKAAKNIVGRQLKQVRNARQLSQAALALLCQKTGWNMTREIIARIEGRVRCVTDMELLLLAELLGVKVQELLPSESTWLQERHLLLALDTPTDQTSL